MARTADQIYWDWRDAPNKRDAQKCAELLLDVIRFLDNEPTWRPNERRVFLNWCDRHGLLAKLAALKKAREVRMK